MVSITETLLRFKVTQLEGKLAIYETLIPEISKLEAIEAVAAEVKLKLEAVVAVWVKCNLVLGESNG